MALYLVIHSPRAEDEESGEVRPPSRLPELARASLAAAASPKWLKTWSPDLHDDRIFTLWEARSGDDVRRTLEEFGFLDDMEATPMRVKEWGPEDVIAAHE
ncbi:MAG: hypothetical protein U0031_08165 [Thermomicrobiales bacterium]